MSQSGFLTPNQPVPGLNVETLTGNTGGAVPADALANINIIGSGFIDVAGTIATNTLTISTSAGGSGLVWTTALINTTLAANHGYVNNNAFGQTVFTLPATAVIGDTYAILGYSAAGWTVVENAGQSIMMGALTTTVATGSLTSTLGSDGLFIICIIPDTTFYVIPLQGNIIVS